MAHFLAFFRNSGFSGIGKLLLHVSEDLRFENAVVLQNGIGLRLLALEVAFQRFEKNRPAFVDQEGFAKASLPIVDTNGLTMEL